MDNQQLKSRIQDFERAEKEFFAGRMDAKDYKKISGGFGSMAEKGGRTGMIRLRMCGGQVSKDKLSFIVSQARKHGVERIHTTTCECVQLHGMKGDDIVSVMTEALDHDIVTQGAGGNNPRNVLASPLTGITDGFDVFPYAKAAERYLLGIMHSIKMPRKLKVAFCSSGDNEVQATFRDLGFVAREDGTFDVWSAGGLGVNPSLGCRVCSGIDPCKTLYCVKAMVDLFLDKGNYEDRSRARTRYMKEDMGEEAYIREFRERLDRSLEEGGLDVHPEPARHPVKPFREVSGERIHPQVQKGLYYVSYHPIGGWPPLDVLERISGAISDMEGAELRISPDSDIYIVNLGGDEALELQRVTEGGALTLFERSVSCIGGTVCQLGQRDSNGLLRRTAAEVREAGIPDGCLPRIHVSGCASSCGCHQAGAIGLQGAGSAKVDGVNVPLFKVTVDGSRSLGGERFGDPVGSVPEDRVPEMFVAIGKEVQGSGMDFRGWKASNPGALESIIEGFAVQRR